MQNQTNPPLAPGTNGVPADLLDKLGEANARFSDSKAHLEAALDSYEPDREERLDRRRTELREAEKQVEDASERIHEVISRDKESRK